MNILSKSIFKVLSVATITLSAFTGSAYADQYPKKPINFVVGFGIGGSADRMTRNMSAFVAEELGKPIKVINKKCMVHLVIASNICQ